MARRYELGLATIAAATGAAYMTIHTGTNRIRLRELMVICNAATASSVALGKPANTPVATTSTLGQAVDPNDPASLTNVDTVWSTAPTAPTNFYRRVILPATIGAGIVWTWPVDSPLIVNASSWLTLWNYGASTGSIIQASWSWEE